MRRLFVLLFLALAGTVPAAAPAHADDLCYGTSIDTLVTREVDTGPICLAYDYAAYCFFDHTWVAAGEVLDWYAEYCVPAG